MELIFTEKFRHYHKKLKRKNNFSFLYSNILLLAYAVIFTIILTLQYNRFVYVTRIYGTSPGFSWARIYFQTNNTFVFEGGGCLDYEYSRGKYEINNDTIRIFSHGSYSYCSSGQAKPVGDFKYITKGDSISYLFNKSDTLQFNNRIIPMFSKLRLVWE